MKSFTKNMRFIARRSRTSTVLNIVGLSIAFAAFIVIMEQVWYDRTYENGIKDSDNMFIVYNISSRDGLAKFCYVSPPITEGISQSPHVIDHTFMTHFETSQMYVDSQYVDHLYAKADPNFPRFFNFEITAGNINDFNTSSAAIVPESFVKKYLGNANPIGKTIDRDRRTSIVAVYKDLPANSSIKNAVYAPILKSDYGNYWNNWNMNSFLFMIKTKSPDAISEVKAFAANLLAERKKDGTDVFRNSFEFLPFKAAHYNQDISGLPDVSVKPSTETMLISIAVAILLIALINFTNFAYALIPIRIRSINIQKILGATRMSLCATLISEAVMICLLSFALSLGFVKLLSLTSFASLTTAGISIEGNLPTIGIALLTAIATGIIAGIFPALKMTSYSPAVVLKGNFGLSPKGKIFRNTMIGFQFFASSSLIIGSLLMHQQRHFMTDTIDYGFDKDEIIVCDISYPANMPSDLSTVINEIKSLPQVENAALSWSAIGKDDNTQGWVFRGENNDFIDPRTLFATSGYLTTMGIKLIEGRDFTDADTSAVIVNKMAYKKYSPSLEIGKQIAFGEAKATVVGICDDMIFGSAHYEIEPMLIYKTPYSYNYLNIRVAKGANMFTTMNDVRRTLEKFDSGYPFKIQFYDQIMEKTYQKEAKMSEQITIFSILATIISIVGVFGLVMFDSEYRRREIAIRKVFGATTSGIVKMFNIKYIKILATSYILAIPASYIAISRWLENFAYKAPVNWWIFAATFLAMVLVTVATVTFQCLKTSKANPIDNLKYE